MSPTAAILIIGNEILSGRTQDINVAFIARELSAMGIRVAEVRVVPDIEEVIIATVNALRARFTYVFTTGGIGPTHDDITSECIAKAFGQALVLNPEAHRLLFNHYGAEKLNAARLRMAMTPEGAILVDNPVSLAPGYQIGNVFVLAGVPKIMQAMFASLKSRLVGGKPLLSRNVTTFLGEGVIAAGLEAIQKEHSALDIGSYPFEREGRYGTQLVLRGTDPEELQRAQGKVAAMVTALGGDALLEP